MRQSKSCHEIIDRQHLLLTFCQPFSDLMMSALGTIAVAAGWVMELIMSAIRADGNNAAAHCRRPAFHNVMDGTDNFRRRIMPLEIFFVPVPENIGDFHVQRVRLFASLSVASAPSRRNLVV